jgi:hypothetical protein
MSGALLGLDQGYGGPGPGTNPITVQQKIVYTAFTVSGAERKDSADSFYGGDVDDDSMRPLRGEPLVMERKLAPLSLSNITRESQLFVFSCINRWGDSKKSKAELVRELVFGGFAGHDGAENLRGASDRDERRALPVFFGGSFMITYNGPDTILTGDLLYWDLPETDDESLRIMKNWRHLKTRPVPGRRTVILRKYDPNVQGMRRRAIRATNEASNEKLSEHAAGRVDQFYKSHVDIVDCLKKVFLLGMVAKDAVADDTNTAAAILNSVKANGADIDKYASRLGLHVAGGVNSTNREVHAAFLSMIAPSNRAELMYEPSKGRRPPTSASGTYTKGERILKHIQAGGVLTNGTKSANVLEHLLASQAVGQHDISSRIVARALSSAKTGGDLDIVEFVQ